MPDRPDQREYQSGSDAAIPSLPDDLRLLAAEARGYAEAELALHKARALYAGRAARSISMLALGALALLFFAAIALIIGTLIALAPLLTSWGATAAVAGAISLMALVCALLAATRWRAVKRRMAMGDRARDQAKAAFNLHVEQLRAEMTLRGIGERVADKVTHDARDIYDQTLVVASESKGIIAGTVAALALWLLRHPIIALIDRRLDTEDETEEVRS